VIALAGLALRSLWNRRGTAALTLFAIAVSVALLLGVQMLRTSAKEGFAGTISGTDLVVGARSGPVNLLLSAVFRIGEPTANVSWATYQLVANHRDVAWTIPLSLGDSLRGFRVVGTSAAYFGHYRYARGRPLRFAEGVAFGAADEAVLGHEVARALGYGVGSPIVLSHGVGAGSFVEHGTRPLRVAGILAPTGTPVDRAVHVTLQALDAIHAPATTPGQGAGATGQSPDPAAITAFLVGMKSRDTVFVMQRALNEYRGEAVQAVIPGAALTELWRIVGVADRALLIVAACVALAGLLGMLAAILTSLNERRREMAILRSVGARPRHIVGLLMLEAGFLAVAGAACGVVLAYVLEWLARPWIANRYGIELAIGGLTAVEGAILLAVVAAALLLSAYPAWRGYRVALADGLTVRL
jgi:putative ABC transport system permease protein